MKINTLVVDDNPNWRKTISKFVQLHPNLNLVSECESAIEAYAQIAENEIDLVISDIEMPEMSGLSLAKSIQGGPLIVFVTSHQHYAFDCYEVSPVDFLLKPLEIEAFIRSIDKVKKRLGESNSAETILPYFFIREGHSYIQLFYQDVQYVQSQEHFIKVVLSSGNTHLPMLSISRFEEQIKSKLFVRVHRSFIVNRLFISEISKNEITLTDGQVIPVGEQYKSSLKRKHIFDNVLSRSR
jgi:DNA-binding LytR/AlgR family response regulator